MLLPNYYKVMNSRLYGKDTSNIKLIDGTEKSLNSSQIRYPFESDMYQSVDINYVNSNGFQIVFGKGTTAATRSDYTLESVINNLTLISANMSKMSDDVFFDISASLINQTDEDITITEFGIIECYSSTKFLLNRELIEPVIIKPNEIYHFAFNIR